jgi:hypothetical protein
MHAYEDVMYADIIIINTMSCIDDVVVDVSIHVIITITTTTTKRLILNKLGVG